MIRFLFIFPAMAAASCDAPRVSVNSPAPQDQPAPLASGAVDDGTYLERIDPFGGQWSLERIGTTDFRRFGGWINFSEGGFLNHGAGCSGGFPAFYRLDGSAIAITRREAPRTGLCAAATPGNRDSAAASERLLASFLDQASRWEKSDEQTLILTAKDGTRAVLTRPREPNPGIAGRWIIETIGGQALVTERRPPTLTIAMGNIGAFADCNSMGTQFTTPSPGRMIVSGPIVGTAIGCAPEDLAEDDLMAKAIRSATGYRLDGARLILTGGPGLVARRPEPPDRRLAGEYASCGNTLLGGYHDGPVTLTIGEGTIRDNAGCSAQYRANGPDLTLDLADTAACAAKFSPYIPGEPVSVGGKTSILAVTRPDGFGFSETGQLKLRTHRGLLTMCRAGSPLPFGG